MKSYLYISVCITISKIPKMELTPAIIDAVITTAESANECVQIRTVEGHINNISKEEAINRLSDPDEINNILKISWDSERGYRVRAAVWTLDDENTLDLVYKLCEKFNQTYDPTMKYLILENWSAPNNYDNIYATIENTAVGIYVIPNSDELPPLIPY